MTRKKEDELGSPIAILEARRQYALQQRQNKGKVYEEFVLIIIKTLNSFFVNPNRLRLTS